jgi:hypothetical protein
MFPDVVSPRACRRASLVRGPALRAVGPHHPGVEPVRNVLRPLRVLAIDDAAEPERGAVRELDRLAGVGHPVDDDTRAEDLLAERPHLRRHVGEDGCLDEGTRPLDALAAGAQRGALGDGVVDLLDERLRGLLRRQRAEVGRRVGGGRRS